MSQFTDFYREIKLSIIIFIIFVIAIYYFGFPESNNHFTFEDYKKIQQECNLWQIENYDWDNNVMQSKIFNTEEISRLTLEPFDKLDPSQMIDLDKAKIGDGNMTVYIQCMQGGLE